MTGYAFEEFQSGFCNYKFMDSFLHVTIIKNIICIHYITMLNGRETYNINSNMGLAAGQR